MTWRRDTPWRQGHVLTPEAAAALGIRRPDNEPPVAVVVSHDCDLAQDVAQEPDVEVIVGRYVSHVDGNFSFGKNPRTLHLDVAVGSDAHSVELTSGAKRQVAKDDLGRFTPLNQAGMSAPGRTTLQRWLASRYRRCAFADEFETRLTNLKVRDGIGKVLKKNGHHISAVYFDVDQGKEVIRSGPHDTYALSIYILYDTGFDTIASEKAAGEAAAAIAKLFRTTCFTSGTWTDIELLECEAISDQAMTVRLADSLARWSVDHMSLRTDPPGVMRTDD